MVAVEPAIEDLLRRQDAEHDEVGFLLGGGLDLPVPNADLALQIGDNYNHQALRQFQRRDLAHLLRLSHAANFSVPGAGKTAVAYGLFSAMQRRGTVERLLVVAPISAFDSWVNEAAAWLSPAPVVHVLEDSIPRLLAV